MSRADRAKQFMPFSALSGYGKVIDELNALREPRITLGEDAARAGAGFKAAYAASGQPRRDTLS